MVAVQSRVFYNHICICSEKGRNVLLLLINSLSPSWSMAWLMLMMPMLNQICCFAPSSPPFLPWCAGTPGAGGASAVISGFLPVGPPIVAWPPVITRTLPTKPREAQKLDFIWRHWRQRRCFGLAVVFPISNYCLVCYAAAAGDAKWWREMPGSNHFPDGKIIPDTCMLSMTQTLHFKGILWILPNKGRWRKKVQVLSTWISLRRASINFLSRSYHGVWA